MASDRATCFASETFPDKVACFSSTVSPLRKRIAHERGYSADRLVPSLVEIAIAAASRDLVPPKLSAVRAAIVCRRSSASHNRQLMSSFFLLHDCLGAERINVKLRIFDGRLWKLKEGVECSLR
jgi:hypothetical protein